METPSIPSLSERENSTKPVPKVFFEPPESNSKLSEIEKTPSFIQKIMTNAKSMLANRYNSFPSSAISCEEPTKETTNCARYVEFEGKVFRETGPFSTKDRLPFTPSDYCLVDEDSSTSKQEDTTATETLTKEYSGSTEGTKSSKTGDEISSEVTFSSSNTHISDKGRSDRSRGRSRKRNKTPSFPYGYTSDLNGPFEPSDFFVNDKHAEKINSYGDAPHPRKNTDPQPKESVDKKHYSVLDNWIKPFRSDRNEIKRSDLNVPCRDEPCNIHSPPGFYSIVRQHSKGDVSMVSSNQPCNIHHIETEPSKEETPSTSRGEEEDEEDDIPPIFTQKYGSTTSSRDVPCFTCGLKRTVVSLPFSTPSGNTNISGRVKTIYCEGNSYDSKIIVCGDESTVSNMCEFEMNQSEDLESDSYDACHFRQIRSDPSSKTVYATPTGTKCTARTSHRCECDTNLVNRRPSVSSCRDQDNQCAFVGSPILQASNFKTPSYQRKLTEIGTSMSPGGDKFGDMISDVNSKERSFHSQIQNFKNREKQYENMFDSLQGEIVKSQHVKSGENEVQRITKELKNENKVLKSEVMEMKLELKHTLDKVQGPMRLKLEAEKSRCEQLQNELQKTSQDMAMTQENYLREMNNLKMQLCVACANMTELENVNRKLKDEMNVMDGLCGKLEDDLLQQKLNEAETIKRLTSRKNLGNSGEIHESFMVYNCESNLHDIARKLSKTIKDCMPCSGLPAELKGAAKLIKELTDMVESRKEARSLDYLVPSRTEMCSQSRPMTQENSTQCLEVCDVGTVVSTSLVSSIGSQKPSNETNRYQSKKPPNLITKKDSGLSKSSAGQVESRYFSAPASPNPSEISSETKKSSSKSPCMRDNQTDPKMVDRQSSSGHVHFEETKPSKRFPSPTTRDGQSDPMVDQNIISENQLEQVQPLPPCEPPITHFPKKIVFAVNTALINSHLKKEKDKDSHSTASRPITPKPTSSRPITPNSTCSRPATSKSSDSRSVEPKPADSTHSSPRRAGSRPEIQDIDVDTTCDQRVSFRPSSTKEVVLEKGDISEYKPIKGPWLDEKTGKMLPESLMFLGLPLRNKSKTLTTVHYAAQNIVCNKPSCPKREKPGPSSFNIPCRGGVDPEMCKPIVICSKDSIKKQKPCASPTCAGRGKMTEIKVRTGEGKSLDPTPGAASAVSESEQFPFEVDTNADLLDEPPEGLNITTCVTDSGNLEVVTEGPAGVIETVLIYKDDGTIEVLTELTEPEVLASRSTTGTTRSVATSPTPLPKSASCHANCPNVRRPCAANVYKEQRDRKPPAPPSPQAVNTEGICPCVKASKSCHNICRTISKITQKASALIQVLNPNFTRDNASSTTRVNVTRGQSCSFIKTDRTSSTPSIGQISATTSEATKRACVSFGTGKISTHDVKVSGDLPCACTQQTVPISVSQKTTGEENVKATSSCSTAPVPTSCKCEDTYHGVDWKSDEEVSCSQDVCDQETCTKSPKKRNVASNPEHFLSQDQACMCKTENLGQPSKDASVCPTLELGVQSKPLPSEQSCQCNEAKDIGVSTSMATIKCGNPPCLLPCSLPCTPCSSKPVVRPDVCLQAVGDSVQIEEYHSASNIPCDPCTCGKELNCVCQNQKPSKGPCDPCTCEPEVKCTCDKSKKPSDDVCECEKEKPKPPPASSVCNPCDCTDKPKPGKPPDEVPSSVCPPCSNIDKPKPKPKPGKPTALECFCPGPCDCVICAPNVLKDLVKQSGSVTPQDNCQTCCSGSQNSNRPPVQNLPGNDQTNLHPQKCNCDVCNCDRSSKCKQQFAVYNLTSTISPKPCTASCADDFDEKYLGCMNLDCSANRALMGPMKCSANREAMMEKRRAVSAGGRPMRHPIDCECVDCLCMPLVRQLAMTRDFSAMRDVKQIYQVSSNCQCPNTKKGSKIPVSTKGGGKPKGPTCNCTGPCTCTPCADPDKRKGPAKPQEMKVKKMTAEQLAQLCDCGKCDCPICAKKKSKAKVCCCTPDCVCDSCKIDMMTAQIEKLRSEVKELKGVTDPPNLGHPPGCDCGICNCPLPPGDDPRRDQPDDCDCIVCDCPLAPGRGGDMTECTCEDCDCPKGPKFEKPRVKKPIDMSGCTCNPCKCPGGPLSAFPICDCKICDCDPCSDPRKPKKIVCDCEPCECNPCGDPKRQAKKMHPPDCTCDDCRCSGLKDDLCTCVTCVCDEKAHPPNCTCDKCICAGDLHPAGCKCPICVCGDKAVDHPPGCQCDKCVCGGPPKPCPAGVEAEKKLSEFMKRTASTHAVDCKCAQCKCAADAAGGATMCTCCPCKCIECIFDRQRPPGHPPGCKCIICKCKDCDGGAGGAAGALATQCKCTDCKCKPCKHKGGDQKVQRAPDCKCTICNCTKCDSSGDKKKDAAKESKSAPALPKNRSCHCITCFCDLCNNPAKKGSAARPGITIPGAGKKTVASGPSAASVQSKKAPTPGGDQPQTCKCGPCMCKECAYGAKGGPNCKCTDCTCRECGSGIPPPPSPKVAAKMSATECSCKPCNCRECSKMSGSHGPGCKCPKCVCQPCTPKPETKEAACHCATCACKECTSKSAGGFETPKQQDCSCKQCTCVICSSKKGAAKPGGGGSSGGFEVPKSMGCQCKECSCQICKKGGGGGGGGQVKSGSSTKGFEVPKRIQCVCKQCTCVICSKNKGHGGDTGSKCSGLALRGGGAPMLHSTKDLSVKDIPPFEPPVRMPCVCNPCKCIMCNKQQLSDRKDDFISARPSTTAAGVQCKNYKDLKDAQFDVQSEMNSCDCPICSCPSNTSSLNLHNEHYDAPDCDCSLCRCTPCADPRFSKMSARVGDQVSTHSAKVGASMEKYSKSTSCISTPLKNAKTGESENRFGACESVEVKVMNLAAMDNATLVKTIEDNTIESTHCKNQIQEITSALSNIKSACCEVEEKAMKTPLIKQASAFGQTMSGLKLALINLQEKCRAKDLLIEAMTGELKNRTNSNTFLQVLDNSISMNAPDYDKAADVVAKNYEAKKCKAIEGDRTVRRKKATKTCKCGRMHKDKDYKNVDLRGFEIIDIRRITDDSIIIKWRPPKTGPITGYDIFINGVNKSKVMSGGRTSAMVHSIDLSSTIQITIYAVTKCGRCEPPAIAIYEIRT